MSEILITDNNDYVMKQCFTGFARVEKKSHRFDLMTQYEERFQGYMDYGPLFDYEDQHPGQFDQILMKSLQEDKPYPEYLPESKLMPWPVWLPKHTLKND